jgi:hypothetical protein
MTREQSTRHPQGQRIVTKVTANELTYVNRANVKSERVDAA